MKGNLRHLRVFLAVADTHSITRAADLCHVSQPAVTQAVNKLEREVGAPLFTRTPQGLFLTPAGESLARRVRRALGFLDPCLAELSPRLRVTATAAQLQALIATREAENFTLAARRMGIAQPTVHRAVTQLEQGTARPLFERTSYGMVATRQAQALAAAARLAFAELDQAVSDLADLAGREVGLIVVGAMPLSRSYLLPKAIARFRALRPHLPVHVVEGPYDDLLAGLRRGEIDFTIGALRDPAPIGDVEQQTLFEDSLVLVARRGHPLLRESRVDLERLAAFPWIVAREGAPARTQFDRLFTPLGRGPSSLVVTGSMILMRELLAETDHLGCISRHQAEPEILRGLMSVLPFPMPGTERPIGLTLRAGWLPTRAQAEFLDILRQPPSRIAAA